MAHKIYDSFVLSNIVEDTYNSRIDLQQFFTIDNELTDNAGMLRKINVYTASDNTKDVAIGEGNDDSINVSFEQREYRVKVAQNRFVYHDEEAMTDDNLVPIGMENLGIGMFNYVNGELYSELQKATLKIDASAYSFGIFADAVAMLNIEGTDNAPETIAPMAFAFVSPLDMSAIRKALGDSLKFVEAFSRNGYVGTVAGVNLYTRKGTPSGECIVATPKAVTVFNKKGVEVEQSRVINTRTNEVVSRKCYIIALTDATKAVKISIGGGERVTVAKAPQATELWGGLTVADCQADDVVVNDGKITGTLKYQSTGALADYWGAGYFLALAYSDFPTGVTYDKVSVGMYPSMGSGLQNLDNDKVSVGKVSNKDTQKAIVQYAEGDLIIQQAYDLSGLTLAEPTEAEG